MTPPRQHWLPAHLAVEPGQYTESPTLQVSVGGGVGDGARVGAGGAAGVGAGTGDGPFRQSSDFPDGHPVKVSCAEGQVLPSGQQASPAHSTLVPGHFTLCPAVHVKLAGGTGAGVGGGEGGGVGPGGPGAGLGPKQSVFFGNGQHPKSS